MSTEQNSEHVQTYSSTRTVVPFSCNILDPLQIGSAQVEYRTLSTIASIATVADT
jgi:hypothetical protein